MSKPDSTNGNLIKRYAKYLFSVNFPKTESRNLHGVGKDGKKEVQTVTVDKELLRLVTDTSAGGAASRYAKDGIFIDGERGSVKIKKTIAPFKKRSTRQDYGSEYLELMATNFDGAKELNKWKIILIEGKISDQHRILLYKEDDDLGPYDVSETELNEHVPEDEQKLIMEAIRRVAGKLYQVENEKKKVAAPSPATPSTGAALKSTMDSDKHSDSSSSGNEEEDDLLAAQSVSGAGGGGFLSRRNKPSIFSMLNGFGIRSYGGLVEDPASSVPPPQAASGIPLVPSHTLNPLASASSGSAKPLASASLSNPISAPIPTTPPPVPPVTRRHTPSAVVITPSSDPRVTFYKSAAPDGSFWSNHKDRGNNFSVLNGVYNNGSGLDGLPFYTKLVTNVRLDFDELKRIKIATIAAVIMAAAEIPSIKNEDGSINTKLIQDTIAIAQQHGTVARAPESSDEQKKCSAKIQKYNGFIGVCTGRQKNLRYDDVLKNPLRTAFLQGEARDYFTKKATITAAEIEEARDYFNAVQTKVLVAKNALVHAATV